MQDLYEGWGSALKDELNARNMSHGELARRVGVHSSTIGRIVAGTINANDELKWKIAGALGLRMDQLWAYPRIVPPQPETTHAIPAPKRKAAA